MGNWACIRRSTATSACTHSFWFVTDTYSPVPMENAPATSPANPVNTIACAETPPPPTPAINAALVTRPSTAPNTVGRNQPPDTSRCRCDQPVACAAAKMTSDAAGAGIRAGSSGSGIAFLLRTGGFGSGSAVGPMGGAPARLTWAGTR
jgi:hypothetical protein